MTIPELCRALRALTGDTQPKWAERLGVVKRTVQHWEAGAYDPHADLVAAMAEEAGVTVEVSRAGVWRWKR